MTARTQNLEMTIMLINTVVQPNPQYNTGRFFLDSEKVGVRRMYTLKRWVGEAAAEAMTETLDLRGMKYYLNGFLYGLYAKK
jgi:hypothetical protein